MNRPMSGVGLWLAGLVALAGCGDDSTVTGATGGDTFDVLGLLDALGDTAVPDIGQPDAPHFTGAETKGGADTDSGESPFIPCPETGGLLCDCTKDADCLSGYCIDTPDGQKCTETCVETCPDGFACRLVSDTPPDIIHLCVPAFMNLCRPCKSHSDCTGFDVGDDRCVSHGDAGSFCGVACGAVGDCPGGYACEAQPDGAKSQCVPTSGECACSVVAGKKEYETTCSATNDLGSCAGVRKCTPDGLTACSAAEPTAEVCNAKDDDCDGLVDEDLSGEPCTHPDGGCTGETLCQGGKASCTAARRPARRRSRIRSRAMERTTTATARWTRDSRTRTVTATRTAWTRTRTATASRT